MLSWPTTLPISQFFLVRRLAAQVKWHCGWSTVIKHSGTGRCRKFLRDIRQRTAHAAGPRGLPPPTLQSATTSTIVMTATTKHLATVAFLDQIPVTGHPCRHFGTRFSLKRARFFFFSVGRRWNHAPIPEGTDVSLIFFFFVFRSRSHVDAHATMTTCAALP